jgi:hypothetical protein
MNKMDDLAKQIAEKVVADTRYFTAVVGFIGVLIGAVSTVLGNIILHRLGAKKERQQEVLRRELDRLYNLEEMAGEITEWAGSWQLEQKSPELRERFHKFMVAAGTFRKYPKLRQAIRDLNQHAMILTSDKTSNEIRHKDAINGSRELEEKYEAFIKEYMAVINQIRT